jgi:hypothetical protein
MLKYYFEAFTEAIIHICNSSNSQIVALVIPHIHAVAHMKFCRTHLPTDLRFMLYNRKAVISRQLTMWSFDLLAFLVLHSACYHCMGVQSPCLSALYENWYIHCSVVYQ